MVIIKQPVYSKYIVGMALCVAVSLGYGRGVTSVVIEEVGKAMPDNDPMVAEWCKKFKPTVKQVKRFFSNAFPIEGRIVHHDYYSPCYATGTVSFPDSSSGKWVIY